MKMKQMNRVAMKGGSYTFLLSLIVLAILIAVNVFVCALPDSITKYDISSSNLYSITSNTKVVVNALNKDVTIYWIVQADEEDEVIENLLSKYESLSNHLQVVKKNPDTYPTFAQQYTDETVNNNSLVVVCGDKYRYIDYNDIYLQDVDYSTYSYVYSFDGEGAITSAIDYVIRDELPVLYNLEGHGEEELSEEFQNQLEKQNMALETLSLLTEDEIPEDADGIMINSPASDISEEEEEMLASYLSDGGKLFVIAGPVENSSLPNLHKLLEDYGVTANTGVVIEDDRDHYAFGQPYILLPDVENSEITDPITADGYKIIVPLAEGLTISEDAGQAVSLLDTSDTAFCKVDGYQLSTYDKEDGDISGPFSLAVEINNSAEGQMIWVASTGFLEDTYNAYSSGANLDFAMNSLASLIGDNEAIAIRTKSLSYNYLTISDTQATEMKVMMIGVIPVLFIAVGIFNVVGRRTRRDEED